MYLNIIKARYYKPTGNIILYVEKQKHFHYDQEQDKCPLFILEILARIINQQKEIKGYLNWKGKSKTVFLCRWHDIIYSKF